LEYSIAFRGEARSITCPRPTEQNFIDLGFRLEDIRSGTSCRTLYTGRDCNYLALVQFACALILGRRIEAAPTQGSQNWRNWPLPHRHYLSNSVYRLPN
jgi:hypothetical protein